MPLKLPFSESVPSERSLALHMGIEARMLAGPALCPASTIAAEGCNKPTTEISVTIRASGIIALGNGSTLALLDLEEKL